MNELPQNLKYKIGREIIDLFLLERQLKELSTYYSDYMNETKDKAELNESFTDDFSLRYMTCQHLAAFKEPFETDEHYLGFNMRVVKREKIFEILSIKDEFVNKCRNVTKSAIMEIYRNHLNTKLNYFGIAAHYFIGSSYEVNFEIEISYVNDQVIISDTYVGEINNRDSYRSKTYENFKDITL